MDERVAKTDGSTQRSFELGRQPPRICEQTK
jgi:hypothetical protein